MHDIPLITTIAAAVTAALILGIVTQRMGLSPLVGYLLAGVCIGPYTGGFEADLDLAQQLAEVGVILLMFGVGLQFHWKDLLAVKGIAIPGALLQSAVATGVCTWFLWLWDWQWQEGMVLGLAVSVASTVVLVRVLMDSDLLQTVHGHVAVGWLVVEDILTVIILIMLPVLGETTAVETMGTGKNLWRELGMTLGKFLLLVVIIVVVGRRFIPWVLVRVAKLRSRELFTLTVLVMAIAFAAGAAKGFGVSLALGAFLAGMLVGQSPLSHQAAADALPLRDAFSVLFFVSVGMLFDPMFVIREPVLVCAILGVILLVKPLVAWVLVLRLGYSLRTALTVAFGLAQIGEFSFILAELALRVGLLPEQGRHVLVASAIFSIVINPLWFRGLNRWEKFFQNRPKLLSWFQRGKFRYEAPSFVETGEKEVLAIIVGYGPVGQAVETMLQESGLKTVIVELNPDTVRALRGKGKQAIYGDASRREILQAAGVEKAKYLVVTLPHSFNRLPLVVMARQQNPKLKILVRARYLAEEEELKQVGATAICIEEKEAAIKLGEMIAEEIHADSSGVDFDGMR
jgi:CPA2 family monovalent cation:H+ antiporter-2